MKIGDYVTAKLAHSLHPIQGVYVADNGDGTIQVRGEGGSYRCLKNKCDVVPDSYLFSDTLEFVQEVRKQLGL